MWRRPCVTILILVIPMILTLPMRAQQKDVAQGLRFGPAAFPSICAATALPAGRQQEPVAPTLRSAHADLKVSATTPGTSPAKPFTEEQVSNMVRDGFGDDSGAKLIEQRGIDFSPSEDFYQTLKAAGASEAFLNALRAAVAPGLSPAANVAPTLRSAHADLKVSATTASPEPASAKKPLNQVQVFALLVGQVPSHRVTMLVQERGIDFEPADDYLQEVRLAGGEDELISSLKSAKVTKPVTVDPAAQARQDEISQHVARAAEAFLHKQYEGAENEYRQALLLDPKNADLHAGLGAALGRTGDWDAEIVEEREALLVNPNDDFAHTEHGNAIGQKGDWDGDIAEQHQALRLNPNNELAHYNLGEALGSKGDWDGDVAEQHAALRLNPDNQAAHLGLGEAFYAKRALRQALTEYREATRLDSWPRCGDVHFDIGRVLEEEVDLQGALHEYTAALIGQEGYDWLEPMQEGVFWYHIGDYAEALHHRGLVCARLYDFRHATDDLKMAVKLEPDNAQMHFDYGQALEDRHNKDTPDWNSALAQYRLARDLDPKNPRYSAEFERLSRKLKH